MISLILDALKENKEISAYRLIETKIISKQLFYVKENLETSRYVNVKEYALTVYKDFDTFRGESTTRIYDGMTKDEVKKAISNALFQAKFVKNKFFELPKGIDIKLGSINSNIDEEKYNEQLADIVDAVLKSYYVEGGSLNANEFFLNHIYKRIINSNGVDYSFDSYMGMIEIIPTWTSEAVSVELYDQINFGSIDLEALKQEIKDEMKLVEARFKANKLNLEKKVNVLISGEEIAQLFWEITGDLTYGAKFQHMNLHEINDDMFLNEKVLVDVSLVPVLKASSKNALVDNDGVVLKETKVIQNNKALNLFGDFKSGYYLNIENPSGNIPNLLVKTNSNISINDIKKNPYLDCKRFSGIQIDQYNDYIGGEVRLAYYFDGEKEIPVSGFSISGKLSDVLKNIDFSMEEKEIDGFLGPKFAVLKNMTIL